VLAIETVFPNLPHFLCHFHFLRDLGTDLFGKENDIIRNRLRKHGIQETLRKRLRSLKPLLSATPDLLGELLGALEQSRAVHGCPLANMPATATYLLILWALAGKSQGKGYGFPFDQPYLVLYRRLRKLGLVLEQLRHVKLQGSWKDNRMYGKVLHDLVGVMNDTVLAGAASRMHHKVQIFDQLRAAMRITLPEGKQGLNDNGELSNIRTIEKAVSRFAARLRNSREYSKDKDYQNMLGQLEQYWQKLFSDPLIVKTKSGTIVVQPQRTNNVVEHLFRDLSRRYRKKSGLNCRERTINAMLADTPLVKNLENENYLSILLAGNRSLEERFAEIDANEVRLQMLKLQNESGPVSSKMNKLIKLSELPQSMLSVFEQHLLDLKQPSKITTEKTSTIVIRECDSPQSAALAIPA
jgi:hypothetical protein